MLILAFDSSAKVATVALGDGDRVLAQAQIDCGLTQSELLLPMAENLLSHIHKKLSDVELLGVSVGPGSFTGVRIAVAMAKGLAACKAIPCAPISTPEMLAENLRGLKGVIVPVMDARRGEVYNAVFYSDGNTMWRKCEDRAIALRDLTAELSKEEGPIYLVGDGYEIAHRALCEAGLHIESTPPILRYQQAASLLSLAMRCEREGRTVSDRALRPTYLRVPQAERDRLAKIAKNTNDS